LSVAAASTTSTVQRYVDADNYSSVTEHFLKLGRYLHDLWVHFYRHFVSHFCLYLKACFQEYNMKLKYWCMSYQGVKRWWRYKMKFWLKF